MRLHCPGVLAALAGGPSSQAPVQFKVLAVQGSSAKSKLPRTAVGGHEDMEDTWTGMGLSGEGEA